MENNLSNEFTRMDAVNSQHNRDKPTSQIGGSPYRNRTPVTVPGLPPLLPTPCGNRGPAAPAVVAAAGGGGGATAFAINNRTNSNQTQGDWRHTGPEMKRIRSQTVVVIERMLRNHRPHDVLTQVNENLNWRSKTLALALKIERMMFLGATSLESYMNEQTLYSRVHLLSRHLVRIRKRKNAMADVIYGKE